MKKVKFLAFICALAVGLSATGCSDTSWAIKSGNIKIPTGVYLYFLLNNAYYVQQSASASGSTTSATASSKSAASTDPWSQKIEGTDAVTWAINNSVKTCKMLLVIEQQCASRNIKLSASEEKTAKSSADQTFTSYQSMLEKNGISKTSVERVQIDSALREKLFNSYYGKGGDKEVPESQLADYYTKNYAHIKQIFINKSDSSGKALTGAKLTAAGNKAKEAYNAAKADLANFAKYVKKYNEDPGMTQNPDGYIFDKTSSSNYDQKFTKLAFSLKVGEIGMTESNMGYFIEYRVAADPKATTFSTYKTTILEELKGTEFQNTTNSVVSSLKIDQNNSAINHYSPKKISFTTTK